MKGFRSAIAGQRFGRLVAQELHTKNQHNQCVWACICDCGNTVHVIAAKLSGGVKRSCGCLNAELARERMRVLRQRQLQEAAHA